MLNTRNRLIGQPLPVTTGLLDASAIDPREVLSPALCHRAAAVIVAHNHPSGDPAPSAEDLRVTRQLIAAARVVGIRLLDHVVIGRAADNAPGYVSLREQGLVSFDAA
jgi:DNA repair protein RadC